MSAHSLRLLGCLLTTLLAAPAIAATTTPRAALIATYLRTPLAFEVNRGQVASDARFLARGPGYTMFLTPAEVVMRLQAGSTPAREAVVRMRFVAGNRAPQLTALEALAGRSHYLVGNDRAAWATDVPLFSRVRYADVYPGIDAVFYGDQRQLEYDLVVAPGADPARIVLAFTGAERVTIDAGGALVLRANGGGVVQRKPVVYQMVDGVRRAIDGAFVLLGRRGGEERVGLRVARYDRSRPLVIDPVVAYATYLGGPNQNDGRAVAVDANGNAYVTGFTNSATFPNVGGLPDPNDDLQGSQDAFVTKLSPTGTLVYSTYLGGSGSDTGNGIAVDDQGSAYVVGETSSADFPTVNPLPPPNDALQSTDGFVTKLGPNGDTIVYSTFLGGAVGNEKANAVAVDGTRNAYVAGTVFSDDFPVAGTLANNVNHGITDAFVSKLAVNGSSLVYSLYLGGSGADTALAIAVRNGEAYVTGRTQSTNFPVASGLPAPNNGLRGFSDGFVTKVNAAGNAFSYSTYLSGSGDIDDGNAIAVDGNGNAYVGGETQSSNFLSTTATTGSLPAPNAAFRGGADGFVAKIGAAGTTLGFLAFVGGSSNSANEEINGLALDADANVYVTGQTTSNDFPVVAGLALQNRRGQNNSAAIVTKIAAAGNAILYSSYLGGTREEVGRGIAVDATGDAFVTGQTTSNDFPVVNAVQAAHGSGDFNFDAFVAKIDADPPPALAYTPGNVFVSARDYGEVREYTPTGTLVRGLPLPSGAFATGTSPSGIAFDAAGHLFVADLIQNAVFEFDATGAFVGTFASGIDAAPQSLVFDVAGNLLVGTSMGSGDVFQYGTNGNLITQFDVFIHTTGSFWMDLAADQRTLFYTTNFEDVATYDLVTRVQGDDFFVDAQGVRDFGLRLLADGGLLFTDGESVRRLNDNASVIKTYTPNPDAALFTVSRDPDGQTFWSAADGVLESGAVFAFDIASAAIVHQFTGAVAVDRTAIGGLAVFGELTEARNGAPPGTPTPLPTRTPAPEVCDDCIDNDFDGDRDRDDGDDCSPRANGMEAGFDPKGAGTAIVKCSKALVKAGNKLAGSRQKHLQKCANAAFGCIQQKPNDAPCQAKATSTCAKELAKLPLDSGKLTGKLVKACGPPALTIDDVRLAAGLGYESEGDTCSKRGVASLATVNDVAACVLAEHACRADNLIGSQVPRAAELLQFAGRDPDVELPCLGAVADGAGGNLGAKAKAAVKCQKTITKAGSKFASASAKLEQKCVASVYTCLQTKPVNPKCRPKATKTCSKQLAKLSAPGKGVTAKLAAAVAKSCTKAPLVLGDVLALNGLGFGALGGECDALNVPVLATITDVSTCIARRHTCRVDQMLENQNPRFGELFLLGNPPP